ncbi:hypothetical protein TanjilG_03184 [Lupinus angustifolius]|uniref:Cytochrome P450 n=2 Tax=Lupinus angustifolius TaxID=3871 RepID=A0A4P1RCX7_LUPAN|nr:hypothetical protein TanjilG_03184 [Lupinus angustifolius]
MATSTGFLFFFFTFIFSLFSFLVFISRMKPWCNCHTCRSYLTKSWTHTFTNLCDWFTHLLKNSPTGTIHVHLVGNIITSNPDNVEYILKTRFDNYPKGKPFSTILNDFLGRGIFNVDGDSWKFQRKMASFELGSVAIRSYAFETVIDEIKTRLIPVLASKAHDKTESLTEAETERSDALDLQDILRRFSFDVTCKFSFGTDPACLLPSLPSSNFAEAFDLASKISAERGIAALPMIWKMKRFFKIGSEKKLSEAINVINDLAYDIIKQRREMGFASKKDLLSRFMGSVNDDDKYLRDIVISFLLAGRDTVSAGLAGFFTLLSKYPKVEELVREEVNRFRNPVQEYPTFDEIRQMHYLNAAVHESLRLFPPVQNDSKFAEDDDVLPDGTVVKKGNRVSYHPYAMGRMEKIWGPDCLEFKPERWLKDGIFMSEDLFKYPVFQAGSRVCLGKELALMNMKSVVATLVPRFDIRLVGLDYEPRFVPGLTASLRGGLPVKVYERKC